MFFFHQPAQSTCSFSEPPPPPPPHNPAHLSSIFRPRSRRDVRWIRVGIQITCISERDRYARAIDFYLFLPIYPAAKTPQSHPLEGFRDRLQNINSFYRPPHFLGGERAGENNPRLYCMLPFYCTLVGQASEVIMTRLELL